MTWDDTSPLTAVENREIVVSIVGAALLLLALLMLLLLPGGPPEPGFRGTAVTTTRVER